MGGPAHQQLTEVLGAHSQKGSEITGSKPYGRTRYKEVNGKKMAYIDEGQGDATVFQHGNPTWSDLWRNIMPYLEGMGRLVACDLIGLGGSEKVDDPGPGRYHYRENRAYLFALWDALDLGDRITLVLHDWGDPLGLEWARSTATGSQGSRTWKRLWCHWSGLTSPTT